VLLTRRKVKKRYLALAQNADTDPDPGTPKKCGSGSRDSKNADPMRIWIWSPVSKLN